MYYCGIFTLPTTGTGKTIYGLPFTPVRSRYTIYKLDSDEFHSAGSVDSTGQEANTTHFDVVPSGETLSDNTRCIVHRTRQSGSLVNVLDVAHHSYGTNKDRFNVFTGSATTQIIGEFWS